MGGGPETRAAPGFIPRRRVAGRRAWASVRRPSAPRRPGVDVGPHGGEVGQRPPLEALSGAALGQVAARERKIGFARGAEVAGAVAEDEYGLAGAAQGAQGRPLAGSRPAARAIAEQDRKSTRL